MSDVISRAKLLQAAQDWLREGRRVIGPRRIRPGLVQYAPLPQADELVTAGFVRPANSIKPFLFPPHERLFAYQGQGRQMDLVAVPLPTHEQIILAARPCDAAAASILRPLFDLGTPDPFFQRRREATTIVTLACRHHDEDCFCTSVGLAPDATRGSDALLIPLDDEQFEVRFVTTAGERLLASLTESSDRTGTVPPGPAARIDPDRLRAILQTDGADAVWDTAALGCLGCGACAHTCPTCHCFDIADQPASGGGYRVRNWDTCQAAIYSLHASGHNPRHNQAARQRNRVAHKFRTYPEKFGEVLCTGCGNCGRNCPAGLGVGHSIAQLMASPSSPPTAPQCPCDPSLVPDHR